MATSNQSAIPWQCGIHLMVRKRRRKQLSVPERQPPVRPMRRYVDPALYVTRVLDQVHAERGLPKSYAPATVGFEMDEADHAILASNPTQLARRTLPKDISGYMLPTPKCCRRLRTAK
jgi:hypothetical protein